MYIDYCTFLKKYRGCTYTLYINPGSVRSVSGRNKIPMNNTTKNSVGLSYRNPVIFFYRDF